MASFPKQPIINSPGARLPGDDRVQLVAVYRAPNDDATPKQAEEAQKIWDRTKTQMLLLGYVLERAHHDDVNAELVFGGLRYRL